jgi:EAL domain-containing protein (putative c-di-GMP-specific phosphodiesterase class I)
MYLVKQTGGNGYGFFVDGGRRHSVERLQLEADLRHAIAQLQEQPQGVNPQPRQMQLHYQPQLDVATGRIVGFEALARWQHPVRGFVPPDVFIRMAEATGLIVPLGRWILSEACRQLRAWNDAGLEPLRMAVNLSAKQFLQPDLVPMLAEALASHGIRPQFLELDLTETVIMTNARQAVEILGQVQQLGVHVAIDDFGTGFSSMNTLRRLPVTKLKIDRSFVQDLGTDARCDAIVRAVIWLGHGLGQQVIAEGVETKNQLACLRAFGCDQFQGYLCSPALPAQEVSEFVARHALYGGALGPPEGLLEAGGFSL